MASDPLDADRAVTSDARGSSLTKKLIGATVFGVVVFAALSFYGDVNALGDELSRFQWSSFGLALILATANYALRFARWEYYLTRLELSVPRGESLMVFLAGFVMSITPGKVGEVFKSVLLKESRDIPIARTAPIVIAERLTDLFALVLLTALGCLVFERGLPIAIAGFALVMTGWLALMWPALVEKIFAALERVPLSARFVPKLREAHTSLRALIGPRAVAVAGSLAVASWFFECVSLWVLADGFRQSLDLLQATFAYSAPTIVGAVAMLPGGLGVTEAGMTGALTTFGVEAAAATGMTILCRLATLWWAVLLGILALGVHRARYAPGKRLLAPGNDRR